jgi:hypothetical protein
MDEEAARDTGFGRPEVVVVAVLILVDDIVEDEETCLEWVPLGSAPSPMGGAEAPAAMTRRGPVELEDAILLELTRV